MAYLEISADVSKNNHWANARLAVGSAMFITYLFHYVFLGLTYFFEVKFSLDKAQIKILQKKMYLFGIGCLVSLNYLQGGTWAGLAAWITAGVLLFLHLTIFNFNFCVNLRSTQVRNVLWLMYYLIIFFWYIGIMADFWAINNNKKKISDQLNS